MYKKEPLLAHIHDPNDLSRLSYSELSQLADEIRDVIISTVSHTGGHLASNLGVVELTIALHRVFDSPKDKIVWDVGHQCYTHKLLTGRYGEFSGLRQNGGISGFPKRSESPHDAFNTGHASTSISAALGLLAGESLKGGDGKAVAVIGDGALTGGLAFEALSHAGQLGLPLVVILNDNKMSISPNVGGLSKYLSRLSMKSRYQRIRRWIDRSVKGFPLIGASFYDIMVRMKRGVKALFYTDNFFVDLGFEYVGPIEGHHIQRLEQVLEDVKKLGKPVVVHVITQKGKGYQFAESDPSSYHGVSPFSVDDGLFERREAPVFTEAFGSAMVRKARADERVVAITAAMEKGTGLAPFRTEFPARFYDVGIAEEHAVSFAAGLAAQGLRPVVAVYSTFIQRSVDQVIHDVALQNLPVTFALDRSGFVGDDGETHQGLFDIALFRSVPNMTILAPAGAAELDLMLDWGTGGQGPAAIRYPKAPFPENTEAFFCPLEQGRGVFIKRKNSPVCLAFTGSLYSQVIEAESILNAEGLSADLYNLRFLKPLDEEYLLSVLNRYKTVFFIEEGMKQGGIGEYAAELALRMGASASIRILGVSDNFAGLGSRKQLLELCGLDAAGIAGSVLAACRKEVFSYKKAVLG
ncbi:1-deoxy-D-xylulose-5-phosphate synthase [Breznakiella homolactica]|uniref:1-deoxy-D-xylulose-5-phosphate synthase n=1 Tax=Breznakiella homolactica TaxID=2798577 RepID=A0A7T7XJP7_9SPIR|nr:1-deoxy-D-xylulose-5-phosphate synthase [Breznakiella homolactica]QQO07467.1 1-deoxy-D-xylulose-5-phosphate synthase [Breznakiella homolactica]